MPFMGRRIGAYFFWFVFFVRAKKMDSPAGAMTGAFDVDSRPLVHEPMLLVIKLKPTLINQLHNIHTNILLDFLCTQVYI